MKFKIEGLTLLAFIFAILLGSICGQHEIMVAVELSKILLTAPALQKCHLNLGFAIHGPLSYTQNVFSSILSKRPSTISGIQLKTNRSSSERIHPFFSRSTCRSNILFFMELPASVFRSKNFTLRAIQFLKGGKPTEDFLVTVTDKVFNADLLLKKYMDVFTAKYLVTLSPNLERKSLKPLERGLKWFLASACYLCPQRVVVRQFSEKTAITFADFTKQMHGRTIKAVARTVPASMEVDSVNGSGRIKRGVHLELLIQLALKYNFTYRIQQSNVSLPYVESLHQELWRSAEVGVAMAQSAANAHLASFTVPVYYVYITFVTAPPTSLNVPQSIISVFSASTWCLIFIASGSFTIVLTALTHWGANVHVHGFHLNGYLSHLDTLSFTLKSYVRQNDFKFEKIVSKGAVTPKVLLIFWLFYVMIIGLMYESKLLSTLVSPSVETVPATFEELLGFNYTITYYTLNGSDFKTLKNSSNPVYRSLVRQRTNDSRGCLEDALQKPKTACLMYDEWVKFVANTGSYPAYRMSTAQTYFVGITWMLRNDSLLKENFNAVIKPVEYMGLVQKWRTNDYAKVKRDRKLLIREENKMRMKVTDDELCMKNETCPSKLKYLQFIFYTLLVGLTLAMVAFVIEMVAAYICLCYLLVKAM